LKAVLEIFQKIQTLELKYSHAPHNDVLFNDGPHYDGGRI